LREDGEDETSCNENVDLEQMLEDDGEITGLQAEAYTEEYSPLCG
jgi:hypothetical protein